MHANFSHLHVHTQYSLLDGACLIDELLKLAVANKLPAIAITDHGNMFGVIEFYQRAMEYGIKPIIGCEVYVAPESRFEKSAHGIQEASFHLILLAKDEVGYKNLIKLVSLGYLEGFYYRPRIDKEVLKKYSKGLVCLSSCLKGEIPYLIQTDRLDQMQAVAEEFKEMFEKGDFYFELMDNSIPEQNKVNECLIEYSKKMDIPLVATGDIHYLRKEDARAHEALLCIQTQTTLDDPNRLRFQTDEFYFKTPKQMNDAFLNYPEAIKNTLEITEKCNLELDFTKTHLPQFQPPQAKTREQFLRELCDEGLKNKYGTITEEVRKRLEHELNIINSSGYTSYFLIAWDFVRYAKSKGIPVGPGRGSAAGSIVSYGLGITNIDPLRYDLLFERFLNPERVSLPDIDIDFCYERRNEVIDYVVKKYTKDNVAQIITFGTMLAKAVLRDVARVMNFPYAEADRMAKLVPNDLNITLAQAIEQEPELGNLYKNEPRVTQLINTSMVLEGLTRHASTHAAGVVISDEPLIEYIPLFKTGDEQITTGLPMTSLEKVGLLKMDFLGLRTLTVIDETVKIIKKTKDIDIDITQVPLDDQNTFKLLSNAETMGVFQLESSGMRELLKKLKPNKFEDIIAVLALFRPGPIGSGMTEDFIARKHKKVPIKYDHPKLESILKETYGIIVYQEQVMRIASELAGFSLSQADNLRRAMSKKTPEVMQDAKEHFINGTVKNGVDRKIADKIFNLIEYFSGYGFNKCVVGSTEIIDADSGKVVTVKDIFSREASIKHTFGSDHNYKTAKVKIKDVVSNGIKPVYKLRTDLGRELIATDNHPVFTFEGWKQLGDLCIGERIALARIIPGQSHLQLESYKIITLAWLLSEGNSCHPSGLYFYNNDRVLVDDFVKNVQCFENTTARVVERRSSFEVYIGTGKDTRFFKGQSPWNKGFTKSTYPTAVELIPRERCGARIWIEELGLDYKKATEKFIPPEIFCLDNQQLALFLGRLWAGDGFVFSKGDSIPFYSTSSYRLGSQVQDLLLRFGVVSRLVTKVFNYRYKNRKKSKVGYALSLYGYESMKNFIQYITPYIVGKEEAIRQLRDYYSRVAPNMESKDTLPSQIKQIVKEEKEKLGLGWREIEKKSGVCMKEFYGELKPHKKGFRRSTILKLAQFFESPRLLRHATSDIVWDRVVSVEYVGNEQTYDLEIEGLHNFIANGVIVHNSHSTAYAMISYRTAYLKANFPIEFMTALLTSEKDNMDKVVEYVDEANRMGINVLPPDIEESFAKFTVIDASSKNGIIRFGLSAVKNVGQGAIDSIIESRKKTEGFKGLFEFFKHIDTRLTNKKVIESLIKCGAFDRFGYKRSALFSVVDKLLNAASNFHKDRLGGQYSFFDIQGETNAFKSSLFVEIPDIPEWPENQLLAHEKEMLGFYVTKHPLARYKGLLEKVSTCSTGKLANRKDGEEISIGGILSKVKFTVTKRTGEKMAIVTLEDLDGTVEVLFFPASYQKAASHIKKDAFLYIKGRLSLREEAPKLIANEVSGLEEAFDKFSKSMTVIMHNNTSLQKVNFEQLKKILGNYQGDVPVYITFTTKNNERVEMRIGKDLYVRPSLELMNEVEGLFGEGSVVVKC